MHDSNFPKKEIERVLKGFRNLVQNQILINLVHPIEGELLFGSLHCSLGDYFYYKFERKKFPVSMDIFT